MPEVASRPVLQWVMTRETRASSARPKSAIRRQDSRSSSWMRSAWARARRLTSSTVPPRAAASATRRTAQLRLTAVGRAAPISALRSSSSRWAPAAVAGLRSPRPSTMAKAPQTPITGAPRTTISRMAATTPATVSSRRTSRRAGSAVWSITSRWPSRHSTEARSSFMEVRMPHPTVSLPVKGEGHHRAASGSGLRLSGRDAGGYAHLAAHARLEDQATVAHDLALHALLHVAAAQGLQPVAEVGVADEVGRQLERGQQLARRHLPDHAPLLGGLDVVLAAVLEIDQVEVGLRRPGQALHGMGQVGPGIELAQHGEDVLVRALGRIERDPLHAGEVAPPDHGLEVEPAAVANQVVAEAEKPVVDGVLAPRLVILGRAEVLEGADRDDAVESAEGVDGDVLPVHDMGFEAVPTAGLGVLAGEGDAHSRAAAVARRPQDRTPAAADVQEPGAGLEPDRIEHVAMLVGLRLLQGLRVIAVVQGTGDVRRLAQAEAEDLVHVVVGSVHLVACGHWLSPPFRCPCQRAADPGQMAEDLFIGLDRRRLVIVESPLLAEGPDDPLHLAEPVAGDGGK